MSSLCVPTAAVFLQGYTGLVYTLEILALLTTMMVLTTRPTGSRSDRADAGSGFRGRRFPCCVRYFVSRSCYRSAASSYWLWECPNHAAAEGSPPSAGSTPSATLPLAEVLRLYKENQAKAEPKDVRPPVIASVSKLELSGRLLENTVDVSAHVELSVLDAQGWVTVRLLRKDGSIRITKLPTIPAECSR
jgi:hypothetical protein